MADLPQALDDTGERMIPERSAARIFWEHVERYRFAARFVPGKQVLDIACGEGYGAAALRKAGASLVIGVDIAPEVVEHARSHYHFDARVGDALAIPVENASMDVVVSFETIEHVTDPERFIKECHRVLSPGGILVISTPNRPVYTAATPRNPFHHKELDRDEFFAMLDPWFEQVAHFSQTLVHAPWWSPRAFSAERSFWKRIKGYWRLTSLVCPSVLNRVDPKTRAEVDRLIARDEGALGGFFNPYRVRRADANAPYYWLAVGISRTGRPPG